MRADAVGNAVGLAVHDADAPIIDAKRLGADLRHRRLEALADRGAAGDDLDGAAGVDRNPRAVGRSAAAFFDEQCDAGAYCFAGRARRRTSCCMFVPAEMRQRLFEQRRIVAGIERQLLDVLLGEFDRVGHVGAGDEIAAAQFDAVDAELRRDGVHHALAHEGAFEAARRAISRGRAFCW